ncbi:MAG: P1 family peptidase [Actinobacteria bacterium]|nr:P1 family peptidase [Actinomycetota bacterium]
MTLPRALGVPLGRFPTGPANAITDVAGVRVGHRTVRIDPPDSPAGEVRTGVTAIWPHEGTPWVESVYAGASVLNGHGELIGLAQIREWGLLRSPLLLTSSVSIGLVYDAATQWAFRTDPSLFRSNFLMPVVTEVSDVALSDAAAFPLTYADVAAALEAATTDAPAQGAVGAGTGTICYDLKGGIGTASRTLEAGDASWTLGALVLTNYGERVNLTIGGVDVGRRLELPIPPQTHDGSCVVVVATDAPLLPHQLERLSVRAGIGLTRSGAFVGHTSGEIAIAFSTAQRVAFAERGAIRVAAVADGFNDAFNPLFEATVECVHEAVLNSLFAAETTVGFRGATAHALPVDVVLDLLRAHGVLA